MPIYHKREYTDAQFLVIKKCLQDKLDSYILENPDFSPQQMIEIYVGLKQKLPVWEYSDRRISAPLMRKIRTMLQSETSLELESR